MMLFAARSEVAAGAGGRCVDIRAEFDRSVARARACPPTDDPATLRYALVTELPRGGSNSCHSTHAGRVVAAQALPAGGSLVWRRFVHVPGCGQRLDIALAGEGEVHHPADNAHARSPPQQAAAHVDAGATSVPAFLAAAWPPAATCPPPLRSDMAAVGAAPTSARAVTALSAACALQTAALVALLLLLTRARRAASDAASQQQLEPRAAVPRRPVLLDACCSPLVFLARGTPASLRAHSPPPHVLHPSQPGVFIGEEEEGGTGWARCTGHAASKDTRTHTTTTTHASSHPAGMPMAACSAGSPTRAPRPKSQCCQLPAAARARVARWPRARLASQKSETWATQSAGEHERSKGGAKYVPTAEGRGERGAAICKGRGARGSSAKRSSSSRKGRGGGGKGHRERGQGVGAVPGPGQAGAASWQAGRQLRTPPPTLHTAGPRSAASSP